MYQSAEELAAEQAVTGGPSKAPRARRVRELKPSTLLKACFEECYRETFNKDSESLGVSEIVKTNSQLKHVLEIHFKNDRAEFEAVIRWTFEHWDGVLRVLKFHRSAFPTLQLFCAAGTCAMLDRWRLSAKKRPPHPSEIKNFKEPDDAHGTRARSISTDDRSEF